jgi:hypothetical protein
MVVQVNQDLGSPCSGVCLGDDRSQRWSMWLNVSVCLQGAGALDMTGYDTVAIRRTIYLTIMSSLDYEEVCHKLLKNTLKPGMEVCILIPARLWAYVVFARCASFAAQIRLGDCATHSSGPK